MIQLIYLTFLATPFNSFAFYDATTGRDTMDEVDRFGYKIVCSQFNTEKQYGFWSGRGGDSLEKQLQIKIGSIDGKKYLVSSVGLTLGSSSKDGYACVTITRKGFVED